MPKISYFYSAWTYICDQSVPKRVFLVLTNTITDFYGEFLLQVEGTASEEKLNLPDGAKPTANGEIVFGEAAAKGDEVPMQPQDAPVGTRLLPVQRDRVIEPAVLEQFLALEQHRDPGRGEHQGGAQDGALLGPPVVGFAR